MSNGSWLRRTSRSLVTARSRRPRTGRGVRRRRSASCTSPRRRDGWPACGERARGEHETTTGQPGLGGTATKLVGMTEVPLLLARHAPTAPPNVLAAVDLTGVSSAVLRWASCCAVGGKLHVFHAYEVPFASRLEAYGVAAGTLDVYTAEENERRDGQLTSLIASTCPGRDLHRIIERGDAASRLLAHVQRLGPTVLVLGKHSSRPGRPVSATYGSVCRHAAFFSPTDVLIVPAIATASASGRKVGS
jgi:nucleotide-binding universal stress UspA family protein